MSTPPPSPATRTVRVAFGDGRGYDVVIGSGVLREVPGRVGRVISGSRPWFLIVDDGVPDSQQSVLTDATAAKLITCRRVSWKPREDRKLLQQAATFIDEMAKERLERGSPVIALGGGITGDIAGFAAAIYQRGTPWVNCPTTLLAMVDASVGGKTGVNLQLDGEHATYKNLIGTFHQPSLVVADVATLASLPERAFRAGLAECAKHALIGGDWGDPTLLDWTKANLKSILNREPATLVELIARNIAIKAAVVVADERESGHGPGGGRMALNLGHTFAHAIETLWTLSPDGSPANAPLQHGEAVGLGLVAAANCAEVAGVCSPGLASEVTELITSCGLPTRVSGLPNGEELYTRMRRDKKVEASKVRLILPTKRGSVELFACEGPVGKGLFAGWKAIGAP